MRKKTIKPDMLAKFKAGEIYVDPQGDLEGIEQLVAQTFPNNTNKLELDSKYPILGRSGDKNVDWWMNLRNVSPIIPLSEMYETAEDDFVMGEEVEVSYNGEVWYKELKYIGKVTENSAAWEHGMRHFIEGNTGYPYTYSHCRRPIRKQTVTLEDLIATYAEKHGIAPETITVDNN